MKLRIAKGHTWLLLTMILWGSAFPSSEWASRQVPHTVAALMRFGGGAIVLVAIMVFVRPHRVLRPRDVARACLTGLVGVFGYNTVFFWGIALAPASDGSVLFPALAPTITTLALVVARQESLTRRRAAGLLIGVTSAVGFFLVTRSRVPPGSHELLGDGLFVVGAAIWAAYTILSRKAMTGLDPGQATAFGMVAGAIALAGLAVPRLGSVHWGALPGGFWANAVYLSIGPTAVAYLLYSRGIRDVGAATASSMLFTVPLFGTAFSYIFLGESFTVAQATAAIVMLGGAYLAVTAGKTAAGRTTAVAQTSEAERPSPSPDPATIQ